jgi:colicin import membrane protein
MVGAPIEAALIGPSAAPAAHLVSKPKPEPPKAAEPAPVPEPPKPEPPKPPEVKQPPPTVPRNDNRDQEKIDELALQKAEAAKREQEEKKRQQQIELDEQKKREEAEAKQQVQKQLEEIRKERDKAAKQTKLALEKMKQLDDLQAKQSPPKSQHTPPANVPEAPVEKTGTNGMDTSLLAEYSSAIQKVVTDNWNRPDTATAGVRCAVKIVQIPGGTVLSANIASPCNADAVTRTSITNAVTKAQPLPYKGYESVFQREITFIFKYDGN